MTTAYRRSVTRLSSRREARLGARRTGRSPAGPPGADRSTPARRAGSSTIGRPAVLRLVLTTTGSPVRRSKPSSIRRTSGSVAGVDRLDPRGAVDVHHGRDAVAPLRRHVVHEQHVGLGTGPRAKISPARSTQHHGRHRPELLAALDVVEPLQVRRRPGVGQQRAVAERAWAELAAALEPGHDRVVGQAVGDLLGDVGRPLVGHPARSAAPPRSRRRTSRGPGRRPASARSAPRRAARRAARAPSAVPASRPPAAPRPRSKGLAATAGSWPRSSARRRRPAPARLAGPLVQPAGQLEQHLLEHALHAGRQVGVVARSSPRRRRAAWPAPTSRRRSVTNPPSPVACTDSRSSSASRGVP